MYIETLLLIHQITCSHVQETVCTSETLVLIHQITRIKSRRQHVHPKLWHQTTCSHTPPSIHHQDHLIPLYHLRLVSDIISDILMTQRECSKQNKPRRCTDYTHHSVTTDKRIRLSEGTLRWGSKLLRPTGCMIVSRLLWCPFKSHPTMVTIKGVQWHTLSGECNIRSRLIYEINTNTWKWHALTQGTLLLMYLTLLLNSRKWHHAIR